MSNVNKATAFHNLHRKGQPFVLYNTWDAGSSKQAEDAGASAIGTGSWSVAAAQGYPDGEALPFELLVAIVERICVSTNLPTTADFEGGFAKSPDALGVNTTALLKTGIVGINFEDQQVKGQGLHTTAVQSDRITAISSAAVTANIELFINARTDLFLQAEEHEHKNLLAEAVERAAAYSAAGASGFFVPGLRDLKLIAKICDTVELPVNVMRLEGLASNSELAEVGVARISHGPGPYRKAMEQLARDAAQQLHAE